MATEFSEKAKAEVDQILTRYPRKQAALLPVLWVAQREFGWVAPNTIELISRTLDVSPAHIQGVLSFYTMYYREPVGKHHLQFCQTLPCALMGSDEILCHVKKRLGIEVGQTTPDKRFTLSTVECLASCGTAPAVRINDTYFENLTEESINKILDELKTT